MDKIFHVELQTPKRSSEDIEKDLRVFEEKYRKVVEAGWIVCITDNPMGLLSYGAMETIDLLGLPVHPDQLMVHLNTFHPKKELDEILGAVKAAGGKYLLIVSGDGSQKLHRLEPAEVGADLLEEPQHAAVEARLAEPVVQGRTVEEAVAQPVVELVHGVGGVGAVQAYRALHAGAPPIPDLHLPIAGPHEQHDPLPGMSGVEQQDGVGLVEAREEEEVGGLAELVGDVAVAQRLLGAGDDGETVADHLGQAAAPLGEGRAFEHPTLP